MNLIEHIGSYEEAKFEYESLLKYRQLDHIQLKNELLKYRRQNNIFEIGDLVVFKEEYSKDSVIHKIDSLRAGTKCLRHATDEEIENGCRV